MIKKIINEYEKLKERADIFLENLFDRVDVSMRPSIQQIKDLTKESDIGWVKFTRKTISLKRRDSLSNAITHAQRSGENRLVQIFKLFNRFPEKKEDIERFQIICEELLFEFELKERTEEYLTLRLFYLYQKLILAENEANCPIEQQQIVLHEGVEAGELGIQTSELVGDIACKAIFLTKTGNLYLGLKRYAEAESVFGEASLIYQKLTPFEVNPFKLQFGDTLRGLGEAQWKLLDREKAEDSLLKAAALYWNFGKPERDLAENYKLLARITRLDEFIKNAQALIINQELVNILNRLGGVRYQLGKLDKAEIICLDALKISQESLIPVSVIPSCSLLAAIKIEKQEWKEAEKYLRLALNEIEEFRKDTLDVNQREQNLENNIKIFDDLIICLIKQNKHIEALEIAEKSKGRTLADLLSMWEFRPKNISESLWQSYLHVIHSIRQLETLLSPKHIDELIQSMNSPNIEGTQHELNLQKIEDKIIDWRYEINEARQKRNQFFTAFKESDPDYFPVATPLKFAEIQELALKTNKTLIMFRVTSEETYVFFLFCDGSYETIIVTEFNIQTLNSLLIQQDAERNIIGGWIYHYHISKSVAFSVEEKEAAHKNWLKVIETTLNKLHTSLISKVREVLKRQVSKLKSNDIVIVPNRGLAILPIHASTWVENGNVHYLLDEYNISYAPSLYSLKRCFERDVRIKAHDKLLLIANPTNDLYFSTEECSIIREMFSNIIEISVLPATAGEILTTNEVLAEIGKNNWLHFSCHGYYDISIPLLSKLLLKYGEYPGDENSLSLNEIMELDLRNTWLTVLSACETGFTDYQQLSDEYVGFPFGFIFAGAISVWCTLYSVDDESTKELMILAYQNLKNGVNKSEALNMAQRELRNSTKYSHPFYWSAFHSVGA